MAIKIEFPADRKDIALAIGKALTEIGQGASKPVTDVPHPDEVSTSAEAGPYYWLHPESDSCGAVDTLEELVEVMNQDPLVEEVPKDLYDKWVAKQAPKPDNTNAQVATQGQRGAGAHAASDSANVDEKGVAFNPEFCGKAAIPFYGSGKKKGQWKKRQGVDEKAYDAWYASALATDDPFDALLETTGDSNVAANAFGGQQQQQQAATMENVPQDAGQLMKWVSEQQAAGNITQQQVSGAYTALQLPFDAVMNPTYPIADNCAAIYNHLKGQIGR